MRFPILFLNSLWPQTIDDPRNEASKSKAQPSGLWPYGDRYVLKLLDGGKTPDELVSSYLKWDLTEKIDLERFHHINWAKAKELDRRSEIRLGGYVNQNFRKTRLFVTRNHPSFEMLAVVRDKVFEALDLSPATNDDAIGPASGGMYDTFVPVHPSVAKFFGLEWWSPDALYRTHAGELPIDEYIRRYAAFT